MPDNIAAKPARRRAFDPVELIRAPPTENAGVEVRPMTSYPRSASRNGWKLPQTIHHDSQPSTSTSVTSSGRHLRRRRLGVLYPRGLGAGIRATSTMLH